MFVGVTALRRRAQTANMFGRIYGWFASAFHVCVHSANIPFTSVAIPAGTPEVASCEVACAPLSPLTAAAATGSSSPCASISPTLGICGPEVAEPVQRTPRKLGPPSGGASGGPSDPHSPEFEAPSAAAGALAPQRSPLLCTRSVDAAGTACTPQLLTRSTGRGAALEPTPQSDALWAFLRSAESQVAEVEARVAAAQVEFEALLTFFGQKVPDTPTLCMTQPAAFLGFVAKVVDCICTAQAQREQVTVCMGKPGS